MTIPEIQDEIRVPELVVLVTEPIAAWREDYELTEKVKDILERAGRNYRSDTFTSLLRELVINGVKR